MGRFTGMKEKLYQDLNYAYEESGLSFAEFMREVLEALAAVADNAADEEEG